MDTSTESKCTELIKDGDRCVIGINGLYKVMVIKKGKTASYEKHKFDWDSCIGQQWGYAILNLSIWVY